MNTTARETLLAALATALARVTKANGYSFDFGPRVFRGLPQIDTPPALVIFDGVSNVVEVPRVKQHTMRVVIEGHVSVTAEGASHSVLANAILGDIIAGVFTEFTGQNAVVNLVSYAAQYDPEITDNAAATVSFDFIYNTPRNNPLIFVET